jgi:hypothetical protein
VLQRVTNLPRTSYAERARLEMELKWILLEQREIFARERSQRTEQKLTSMYANIYRRGRFEDLLLVFERLPLKHSRVLPD